MILTPVAGIPCRVCGHPVAGTERVLSRHSTSEGVVVWVRCPCGAVQARMRPYAGGAERVVVPGATGT